MSEPLLPPREYPWEQDSDGDDELDAAHLEADWVDSPLESEQDWFVHAEAPRSSHAVAWDAHAGVRIAVDDSSREWATGPNLDTLTLIEDFAAGRLTEAPEFGVGGWSARAKAIEQSLRETARSPMRDVQLARLQAACERLAASRDHATACLQALNDACAKAAACMETEAVPQLRAALARARQCLHPCRIEASLAHELRLRCRRAERCIDDFGLLRLSVGLLAACERARAQGSARARRDLASALSRVRLARHAILRRADEETAHSHALQRVDACIEQARTVLRALPILGALRVPRSAQSETALVPVRGSRADLRLFTALQRVERYAGGGTWSRCGVVGHGLYAFIQGKLINLAPARLMRLAPQGDGTYSIVTARALDRASDSEQASQQQEPMTSGFSVFLDGGPLSDAVLAPDQMRQVVLWALRHRYLGRDRWRVLHGSDLENEIGTALGLTPRRLPWRTDGSLSLYCPRANPQLGQVVDAIRRVGGLAPRLRVALIFEPGGGDVTLRPGFCVEAANGEVRLIHRSGALLPQRQGLGHVAEPGQFVLALSGTLLRAEPEVALFSGTGGRARRDRLVGSSCRLMHGTAAVFGLLARGAGAASLLGVALALGDSWDDFLSPGEEAGAEPVAEFDIRALPADVTAGLLFWGANVLADGVASDREAIYSAVNVSRLLGWSN